MKIAPFSIDEQQRLEALGTYQILDTDEEKSYDDLTKIAAQVCGTNISLISLVDSERQWFKSRFGLNVTQTHRDLAFCSHAILEKKVFIVEDSRNDERFFDNPLVVGEPRVIFYAGVPLIDPDGFALGTLCVINDQPKKLSKDQIACLETLAAQVVTSFRLRRELEKNKKLVYKFNQLATQVPGVIFQYEKKSDGTFTFPYVTESVRDIFEVSADEVYKDADIVYKRILSEDLPHMFETMKQSVQAGFDWECEYRVLLPKKGLRWLRGHSRHEKRSDGSVIWHGFISDITEEKNTERELANEILWNQYLLEGAHYAVISTLPNGTITTFNTQAEKMLGYKKEEVIGKCSPEIFHLNDEIKQRAREIKLESGLIISNDFDVFIQRALRDGSEASEWTYVRKDGTRFPVRLCVTAIRDQDNNIIGYVGFSEDLTEQKKLEAIVEAQRVQMVNNAKLASLGEMAGGVAHEINNPLAIISGRANILKKDILENRIDNEKLIHGIDKIEKTALRISKIIRGLRVFSRNAENDPMECAKVSQIIEDTLELCKERFRNHSIELNVNCPSDVEVICRPAQISQVLTNLLSNAFDAVEVLDEKWIKISVENLSHLVQIRITDSGKGIHTGLLEKIMQPFFSTKEVGKGTGLGLSISRTIVHEHGGLLRYNPAAENTEFVIELPVVP